MPKLHKRIDELEAEIKRLHKYLRTDELQAHEDMKSLEAENARLQMYKVQDMAQSDEIVRLADENARLHALLPSSHVMAAIRYTLVEPGQMPGCCVEVTQKWLDRLEGEVSGE